MRLDHTTKWVRPYPPEEQDVRAMCGDPVAVAYHQLQEWLGRQSFKPAVSMHELTDCLWVQKYGTSMTRYEIVRDGLHIPEIIPDELYNHVMDVMF